MKATSPFAAYLESKVAIDDRALHPRVTQAAWQGLTERPGLRVLELGAGVGTMLQRLWRWGLLPPQVHYTAVERDPGLRAVARQRLARWTRAQGGVFREAGSEWVCELPGVHLTVAWHTADVFAFLEAAHGGWNLVLAHAFVDLVPVQPLLDALLPRARGARLWFTLNFDGGTHFWPVDDAATEAHLMQRYHATMQRWHGPHHMPGAHTGRVLLAGLSARGLPLLAVGSSDWVVYPQGGRYPAHEAHFLRHIVETVHQALRDDPQVPAAALEAWRRQRLAQIEAGRLVYIAHQIDLAAQVLG